MTHKHMGWLLPLLLLILVAGPAAGPASAQGGDLRMSGLEGGELRESELSRGTIVLVVWASWSPRCRDIVEQVNGIAGRWGSKARVVALNFQEDRATVEEFLSAEKFSVPVYLDTSGAFSKKHAVTTLPALLVFRDGEKKYSGRLPADVDQVLGEHLG